MPGADGMSAKFMKNAFVGWTFTAGLYYPPDFDASKLLPLKALRGRGEKKETALNIRMMFPFTMICDACGEYNYTGTKFTSKCEEIKGESYLGIKVFRFYGRCRHCWAEFTFKTDPKNSDYTMESGGKRTYEAWKDADMMEAQIKQEKEEAKNDQMKALEQKTIDVQAEMQRLDDLDSIRTLNKRLGNRDQSLEAALEYLFKKKETEEEQAELLSAGEAQELEGFKAAQEDEKRKRMDEQCEEKEDAQPGGSSSSSAGASGSASGSSGVKASSGASSDGPMAGAGIAAAVAERVAASAAARSTVGAKFTVVKRKAPGEAAGGAAQPAAKTLCVGAGSSSGGAAPTSVGGAAASGAGMGIGLGAYDSDSS